MGMVLALTLGSVMVWWVTNIIYSLFISPLRDIPSPLVFQIFPIYYDILQAGGSSPFELLRYHQRWGRVFRTGWGRVLFVDGDAAFTIYGTHDFIKSDRYKLFEHFGENIMTVQERAGHRLRKRLLTPGFTRAGVRRMLPLIVEAGLDPLLAKLDAAVASGPVDMYGWLRLMAFDIIGAIGFGQSFNMLQNGPHPILQWLQGLLAYSMVKMILPALDRYEPLASKRLRQYYDDLLRTHLNNSNSNNNRDQLERVDEGAGGDSSSNIGISGSGGSRPVKVKRLLDYFSEARDEETGKGLSYGEILAEAHILMLTGTDTTSDALTWLLYNVATHPEVEQHLVNELTQFYAGGVNDDDNNDDNKNGNSGGGLSVDQLPYLNMVIKESLRTHPPGAMAFPRIVPHGGRTVCGHFLPQGTEVGVPIYALHRSPHFWDRPDRFDPGRWGLPQAQTNVARHRFLPFLLGPRGCIGKELAQLELATIAAQLLVRYRFTPLDPPHKVTIACDPAFRPRSNHLKFTVMRR